jgi:hypothetical protein
MSSTISAALLFLFASALAPKVSRPALALPEAVLAHPAAETDPSQQPAPRWSAQALAAWPGPWGMQAGLYDHRYVTW